MGSGPLGRSGSFFVPEVMFLLVSLLVIFGDIVLVLSLNPDILLQKFVNTLQHIVPELLHRLRLKTILIIPQADPKLTHKCIPKQ